MIQDVDTTDIVENIDEPVWIKVLILFSSDFKSNVNNANCGPLTILYRICTICFKLRTTSIYFNCLVLFGSADMGM